MLEPVHGGTPVVFPTVAEVAGLVGSLATLRRLAELSQATIRGWSMLVW